jgi:hypothetical protein
MSANTYIKVSNIVEQQFPDHWRTDGANLVGFIKAYYEWAEQAGKHIEVSQNLTNNWDIDLATDEYFEFLKNELLVNFPNNALGDKRLFAKYAKDFYRARGSEASYQLLFRILYGEEISVYYPGDDILRVSDGRWVQENSIRVLKGSGDPDGLYGRIIGLSSGATGLITQVNRTEEAGRIVWELFLKDVFGEFINGESLVNSDSSITVVINTDVGPAASLEIPDGGAFHEDGDTVTFISPTGSGAFAVVTSTSNTSAVDFPLTSGGYGYTVNATATVVGGSGSSASFRVTSIANTIHASIATDLISPMTTVPIKDGITFTTNGANNATVGANLASSNVSSTLSSSFQYSNVVVGTITSLQTLNYGYGYETLPTTTITEPTHSPYNFPIFDEDQNFISYLGDGASSIPVNAPGAISTLRITNTGSGYLSGESITVVNITDTSAWRAIAIFDISGIFINEGKYVDTRGWLSWNCKLQDNYYYQEYSYVVNSEQNINEYRDFINTLLHPAGTQLFGTKEVIETLDVSINNAVTASNLQIWTLGTGTVNVSNGSFNVSGTGTAFTTQLNANSEIFFTIGANTYAYGVNSISTDTTMTIERTHDFGSVVANTFYYRL